MGFRIGLIRSDWNTAVQRQTVLQCENLTYMVVDGLEPIYYKYL